MNAKHTVTVMHSNSKNLGVYRMTSYMGYLHNE